MPEALEAAYPADPAVANGELVANDSQAPC